MPNRANESTISLKAKPTRLISPHTHKHTRSHPLATLISISKPPQDSELIFTLAGFGQRGGRGLVDKQPTEPERLVL